MPYNLKHRQILGQSRDSVQSLDTLHFFNDLVSPIDTGLSFDMYVGLNGAELYDVYDKEYRSFYKFKNKRDQRDR